MYVIRTVTEETTQSCGSTEMRVIESPGQKLKRLFHWIQNGYSFWSKKRGRKHEAEESKGLYKDGKKQNVYIK